MRRAALTDPLRRRGFRRLAASYAVNELGDWMGIVALSVLVYDRTGSAFATAVLFLGTGFLPAILAPILVARVERPPPRYVLPVLYAGEAAAFAGLVLFSDHFSLTAVFILATLDGALALAARALTRAVAAAMLEPSGELRAGNAILNVAFTGGAAIGPAIAGLVVAGFGVETALLLDAVSFYAIAWILLTAGPLPQATPDEGNTRERLRAGFAYVSEHARLKRLMVAQGIAFIFFAAVIPIEVIYAKETLDAGDAGYGLLLASWGAGMVIGSIVFATLRRAPLPYLLFFSTVTIGLGYLGMAAAPVLATACIAATVGGAGNGVQWVAIVSAVQELTVENMQARVMSVLESIGAAMPGVGYLLGGLIATADNPRATFAFAGAGVLAIALVVAPILGSKWPERLATSGSNELDGGNDVVLELIPGSSRPVQSVQSTQSDSEVLP
ncbi:MAG TPA: MFS transporter [Solirubrobacterales bacterium]|nr:MFS transporter [Solirubrobacterales bacterium]